MRTYKVGDWVKFNPNMKEFANSEYAKKYPSVYQIIKITPNGALFYLKTLEDLNGLDIMRFIPANSTLIKERLGVK